VLDIVDVDARRGVIPRVTGIPHRAGGHVPSTHPQDSPAPGFVLR
jgi:hypothetical protein